MKVAQDRRVERGLEAEREVVGVPARRGGRKRTDGAYP